jgi:TonB family protein
MAEEATSRRRWIVAVVASLALHLVIVLSLERVEPQPPSPEAGRTPVAMKIVDRSTVPGRAAAAAPEKKLAGEVVDIPKPAVERVPEKAKFLSRWNTATDREQKARSVASRRRPVEPPEPPKGEGKPSPKPLARTPAGTEAQGAGAKLPPGAKGPVAGTGSEPVLHGLRGLDKLLLPTLDGADGGGRAARGMAGYVRDDAMLGVADEGDTTLVNSRSFKYWDFFQRVKERVRSEWNPADTYRARDPYGKVYGSKDRLTVLGIVLDADGRVARIEVVRESGLPFLDHEAMRAFREAGPFPNPPSGLADERGRIAFHFGFLLELSSSKFKMFWQPPE